MNTSLETLRELGLQHNPFPPATTGVAFVDDLSIPPSWDTDLNQLITNLAGSVGDKALVIVGGYGSGKTFILNWIARKALPQWRVQPYFFDNPGVAFYDLANRLMRQIGRYELSKALWEMFYSPGEQHLLQPSLIQLKFPDWLTTLGDRKSRSKAIQTLSRAMQDSGLATDEEISNKFARVIVETRERPYYEYRDFVPRSRSTLVPEQEEANFFRTLIRALLNILQANGIAFLIDEFEDVALARRLNKRQTSEYIATMRRLLDTAQKENLWVILSMTPEGFDQTTRLDPSLMQRFIQRYDIPPLADEDALGIVIRRLNTARSVPSNDLKPFPDNALSALRNTTRSSPRRLIKVLWHTLSLAAQHKEKAPISINTLQQAEEEVYPRGAEE